MSRITAQSLEDPFVRSEARFAAKELSALAADAFLTSDERLSAIKERYPNPEEDKEIGYVYSVKLLLLDPALSNEAFTSGCTLLAQSSYRGLISLFKIGMDESLPEHRRVEAIRLSRGRDGLSTAVGMAWDEVKAFLSTSDSSRNIVIELGGALAGLGGTFFDPLISSVPKARLDDHALWIEILRGITSTANYPQPEISLGYPPVHSTTFSRDCIRVLQNGHSFPEHLAFRDHFNKLSNEDLSLLVSIIGSKAITLGKGPIIELLSRSDRPFEVIAECAIAAAKLGDSIAIEPLRQLFKSQQLDEKSNFRVAASLWGLGAREPRSYLAQVFESKSRLLDANVTSSLVSLVLLRNKSETSVRWALKYYQKCIYDGAELHHLLDNLDVCIFCSIGKKPLISDSSSEEVGNKLLNKLLGFVFELIGNNRIDDSVRMSAINRFKFIAFPGVRERLIAEANLEENSNEFRVSCIRALGPYYRESDAAACLEALVESADPTIKRAALVALDKNLSPEGVGILREHVATRRIKELKDSFLTMSLPDANQILYESLFNPDQFFHAAKCLEKKLYSEDLLRMFIEDIPKESVGYKERYRRALSMCPDLGILAPFRYPPQFLVELVQNRVASPNQDSRRKLLYLVARSDHNGALTEFASIIHQISERFRHRVVLHELVGSRQYGTVLEEVSKTYPQAFDAVIVAGHGAPDSITLGPDSLPQRIENQVGDSSLNLKNIYSLKGKGKGVLKDGGYVYLHSCSTAREIQRSNIHTLHRAIFPNARDLGVSASRTPLGATDIFFSFSPEYDISGVEGRTLTFA